MKTFSFLAGSKADKTRGMQIVVDRTKVPTAARVGLRLDDDGKAYPNVPRRPRPLTPHGSLAGASCPAELVLLDRARVRAKVGPVEGILTLQPGTRFDLAPAGDDVGTVSGAEVKLRSGLRVAEVAEKPGLGEIQLDKLPGEQRVLTLEWEPPRGAVKGERHVVDVVQRSPSGVVTGGLRVEFVVD
jgi:hypothetical protein